MPAQISGFIINGIAKLTSGKFGSQNRNLDSRFASPYDLYGGSGTVLSSYIALQHGFMENFFPLFDDQPIVQLISGKGGGYIGNLRVVNRYASLLDQPAGFSL